MNSGTFHVLAQEWRYYSREKSLIHTLHVAELPPTPKFGDTVDIASTPAVTNGSIGGGGIPPMQLPGAPWFSSTINQITNTSLVSDCYGSVNWQGTIEAQRNMGILIAPNQIIMIPEQSGYYVVHFEAQSDLHTLGYQGPAGDGEVSINISRGNTQIADDVWRIKMEGGWDGTQYVNSILHPACEALTPCTGDQLKGIAFNIGSIPPAYVSMWAMKVGDL